jgi:hypothetical protein
VTTQPECGWDASTNVSWISALSPPSGQGTANVSFRVAANDGTSARDGMIVVNGEQVRVSQRAPCRYDVGPSSQSIGANGGAFTLKISAANECGWKAASDAGWIALTSTTEGTGNGAVNFTVAANQGGARNGAIVVADQRSTIRQAGADTPSPPPPSPPPTPPPSSPACSYSISPRNDSIPVAGDSGTVQVSTASTCSGQRRATPHGSALRQVARAQGTALSGTRCRRTLAPRGLARSRLRVRDSRSPRQPSSAPTRYHRVISGSIPMQAPARSPCPRAADARGRHPATTHGLP